MIVLKYWMISLIEYFGLEFLYLYGVIGVLMFVFFWFMLWSVVGGLGELVCVFRLNRCCC